MNEVPKLITDSPAHDHAPGSGGGLRTGVYENEFLMKHDLRYEITGVRKLPLGMVQFTVELE